MTRNQLLLSLVGVVVVSIALAVIFPVQTQRLMVQSMFHGFRCYHEYIAKDTENKSAGALAIESLFHLMPVPSDVAKIRATMEGFIAFVPLPSSARVEEVSLRPDLKGYWVIPEGVDEKDNKAPVVLYFHGGGYVAGSANAYLGFGHELAARIKGRVFVLDYRLGPENPLPAAPEDALLAYKWLVNQQKINPKRIAVAGDSAGGGLTLLLLLAIQNEDNGRLLPPAAAVTFSAWTDLCSTAEGRPSYQKNQATDAMLSPDFMSQLATLATGTKKEEFEKRKSPKFSPIYASLDGVKFPPLLMQVGGAEILHDDTVHFVSKAKQARVGVTLEDVPHMQHIYAFFFAYFEEANKALDSAVTFITTYTKVK